MVIIDRIEELMKEKGVKVQFLCGLINANRSKIYDWKRGKSTPTPQELEILADYFNVSVEYLMGLTDKKNKPADFGELTLEEEEYIKLFESLSEERQREVLDFLRFQFEKEQRK